MISQSTALHFFCHIIQEEWTNESLEYFVGKNTTVVQTLRSPRKPYRNQDTSNLNLDVEVCAADNHRDATAVHYFLYNL